MNTAHTYLGPFRRGHAGYGPIYLPPSPFFPGGPLAQYGATTPSPEVNALVDYYGADGAEPSIAPNAYAEAQVRKAKAIGFFGQAGGIAGLIGGWRYNAARGKSPFWGAVGGWFLGGFVGAAAIGLPLYAKDAFSGPDTL